MLHVTLECNTEGRSGVKKNLDGRPLRQPHQNTTLLQNSRWTFLNRKKTTYITHSETISSLIFKSSVRTSAVCLCSSIAIRYRTKKRISLSHAPAPSTNEPQSFVFLPTRLQRKDHLLLQQMSLIAMSKALPRVFHDEDSLRRADSCVL